MSNSTSVWSQQLPCLYHLLSKYWNTSRCPAKQTTLGRGRRGRSLREDVVDNGGDQPILQDETGLTRGTSVRDSKKVIKIKKMCQRLLWWTFSAKLTDYLPSMEQQEDGHCGSHNLFIFTQNYQFYIRIYKMLAILGFQIKLQIKLPSPAIRTGNGQGQK